ncbi:hypothetical protein CHLRE_03g197513v5 [Chlamydomonas reinhardtii]|uniref:YqaE/Pmp3 family membrane protein n=1 Tax=Chlamydomonas reinhardtii TaxID=3055 RepID=A0A2K3DYR3_CHLRE|nr:uncharacterized protein CHLRE_03g197513v5 [Chlamydomonas reinhardtii]PNW85673.1 hypothetical protein CHLRE_03g197513v5 [Chlamydomonas reinhardtii]
MEKILLIIITFLLPPLGVFLHTKQCNRTFWINLLLTLLFWLPGFIHGLMVLGVVKC